MRIAFVIVAGMVAFPAAAQVGSGMPASAPPLSDGSASTSRATPPDPARLAVARVVMAKLFPPGTYRALIDGAMAQVTGGMMRQMMDLPIAQLAGMAGVPKSDLDRMGPATLRQLMDILDPAFEQRRAISTKVMLDQITEVIVRFEPDIREGYAEAYAYRMTAAQLRDLDRFLETPSGGVYAANAIRSSADPAVVKRMEVLMPEIFKAMPAIVGKVQAATADLPKPKKPDELTNADRERLAKLIGVDAAKLKQTQKKEPTS